MATSFLASLLLPEHSPIRGQKLTFKTYGKTLAPSLLGRASWLKISGQVSMEFSHHFAYMKLPWFANHGYSMENWTLNPDRR